MRRIAIVNQKGGVGKTTTVANLGAALARRGKRVVLVDLDPQGNLSTHLDVEVEDERPSSYGVLCDGAPFADALRATTTPGLFVVPADIDLSGAEMELAAAIGRESILRDALDAWEAELEQPVDYVLFDCPPSLGLLSVNGLVAAREVFITLQTEFFALKGMSKLVEIVQLLKRRLNPELEISGIIACLYDSRLRLAREVLAEIRRYFPGPVFRRTIRTNVKLAEAPSHGVSIFDYAPESAGAGDYMELAEEVLAQVGETPAPQGSAEPKDEPGASTAEHAVQAAQVEQVEQPARAEQPRQPERAEVAEQRPTDEPPSAAEATVESSDPGSETSGLPPAEPVQAAAPAAGSTQPETQAPPAAPEGSAPDHEEPDLPVVELTAQPAPPEVAETTETAETRGAPDQPVVPREPDAPEASEAHEEAAAAPAPRFAHRAPSLEALQRAADLPPLPAEAFRKTDS